ncbi:MAG: NEW3 domain-containing protein [Bacteroidota bacterium]|nr:NEW3 domain-containing protein [Bacteroidota bacterium]
MASLTKHSPVLISVFLYLLSTTGFAAQKADSVILYTQNTKVSVTPGQMVDYQVDLINNGNELINADISLSGLPSTWKYTLRSGSFSVSQMAVLPHDKRNMSLSVIVPMNANKGSYHFRMTAGNLAEMPLTIVVSEQGTFKSEFTTDQANMQGNNSSVFTYQANLKNSTAETQTYSFQSTAPRGWSVAFKSNSRQVTSVEVNPNSSVGVTIEIDPPDMAEAGTYRIPVSASTSSSSAELALEAVITGTYGMELSTPTGLLSTSITAGELRRIELIVKNTGSAILQGVQLSASAPLNWEVSFDPRKIDMIEPGKSAGVTALIKAAKKAIAGDYVTSIDARTPEATSKAQFRISVRTSMLWGWVGILIICSSVAGIYYLFRKYGRR